ncbi:DUF2382 domain-containing protein [Mycetocola miduiensis]|uniref:Conserved domain-containing protein n=1 Tax=Mycetocola miduiensis TaxID=995034 RepID=A0A1I4YFU0_9MICO|nr:PRC and DUF2382 domain-containing protein [Mycetocola miduiensis]SFN36894.1 conserved domain-containing protein [Mycetocola miduiensis]
MIETSSIDAVIGATAYDNDGDKIGKVGQVYVDPDDGRPVWASVNTGFFGTSESFVPLENATPDGDTLRVPYDKAFVKDAPRIDVDGELSTVDQEKLYEYYGMSSSYAGADYRDTDTADYTDTSRRDTVGGPGQDTSGPNTDSAMTRSEQQLNVGTQKVQTGKARLRKYVVTEQQNVTVPVQREEVRLEREPITDANVGDAMSGPDLSNEEHEVTLTEERVVIEKETVPVERVRLDKDTVTEQQSVSEEVAHEEIELEGDTTVRGTDRDRV